MDRSQNKTTMPVQLPHKYHDEIAADGFTVIRGFLSEQEISKYYRLSQELIKYARDGNWPLVRTRGKQFPPWPSDYNPDIWGVSSLLHPDLKELSTPYHDFYADKKLLAVVRDILQCEEEQISMELLNMLINPLTDFELDWHRDTIKPEVSPEEELEQLLTNPYAGTQFNLALTNDECLIVIPKSHNRIRTAEERKITLNPETRKDHITGQIFVNLKPGDVVFYNSNILHGAKFKSANERITLHGSYGNSAYSDARAKGVLQHGVGEWLPRFQTGNKTLAELRDKLLELAKKFEGQEVEYALDG